ncbi:MAG: hypothetical protein K1000chlam3_01774 [Chlamydiae bacterium]|nr:hypothetical protein [Chlamydiota bacterium]
MTFYESKKIMEGFVNEKVCDIHIPIQELEFWPGGPQIFHLRRASVFIDTEREAEGKFEE